MVIRINIDILGIGELKWVRMDKFNSDDHLIYYCGQESHRRNGPLDTEEIKKRWKKYTVELYKKIFMNWITVMLWSVTQSHTLCSVKASGPEEALLLIKLVDAMGFQWSHSQP